MVFLAHASRAVRTWRAALLAMQLVICVAFPVAAQPTPQGARREGERRVALVIGNGAYASVGQLANPVKDAAAVAELLRRAGFDTTERHDVGAQAMRRALRDFADKARDADIAIAYFAGHGIEVGGTNYLLPVDAVLHRDLDVEDEGVPLERVSQVLGQTRRLRLVILDACRDNPFARNMRRGAMTRSVGSGLAQIEVTASDTLVAYAAKAGSTALDGDGANSPYTTALLKHLATPGLDVRLAFGRVRDDVLAATGRRQEPFVYGSLGGSEMALVPVTARPAPSSEAASREWQDVKDATSIAALEAFAARHRADEVYRDLARSRIAHLKRGQTEAAQRRAADAEARMADSVADLGRLTRIATRYANGDGVPQDWARARELYERAATRGSPVAMTSLAHVHLSGRGVPRDVAKGREWLEKAAQRNHAPAMNDLGVVFERGGPGIERDYAQARAWYEKAAAGGYARSMGNLATLYANGHGVPRDLGKAHELFLRAAANGNARSMFNLAHNYENGIGIAVDCRKALDWFRRAEAAGYESAKARIARLDGKCPQTP